MIKASQREKNQHPQQEKDNSWFAFSVCLTLDPELNKAIALKYGYSLIPIHNAKEAHSDFH